MGGSAARRSERRSEAARICSARAVILGTLPPGRPGRQRYASRVSYLPYHPAQLGILIPEDPRAGYAPVSARAFVFDQLTSLSHTFPGQVARHPTERAEDAPTDAILLEPPQLVLSAELVDKPLNTGFYPFPTPIAKADRALNRAADLARLRDAKTLFTVVAPGIVVSHRAISQLIVTPSPDDIRVSVQLTLERVVLVDLLTSPAVADADSVALGAQKVETGYDRTPGRTYSGTLAVS